MTTSDELAGLRPIVLGQIIVRHRERRDLSQTQLAIATRVTQATISRIEHGEATPDAFAARRIADALNVTLGDLHGMVDLALDRARDITVRASGRQAKPASWWRDAEVVWGNGALLPLLTLGVVAALNSARTARVPRSEVT